MKKSSALTHLISLALVLVTALLTHTAASANAQEEPVAEFGSLVEVTEVFLDVQVTDRRGNIIEGLGIDDFVVEAEGQPVEITSASFYTTRYGTEQPRIQADGSGEIATEVPSSRYFIFFFHDQRRDSNRFNRLVQQQRDAGKYAHDWVRDEMGPSDWVAVIRYDVRLIVHQDFTQNTASLLQALHDVSVGKIPEYPSRREFDRLTSGSAPSLWRGLPDPSDIRDDTKKIYKAIQLVAEASRPMIGRKNMFLFTTGFGELRGSTSAAYGDSRYYPAMEEALNDSNVAVYTIDMTVQGTIHAQQTFLSQLAGDTGGEYYQNFSSFSTPLRRIGESTTGYYLLSFRAEHAAGESGYRHLKVKTTEKKTRVNVRKGYRYGIGG